MKPAEVVINSLNIRDSLIRSQDYPENPIDGSLLPIPPFRVRNKIKLVVIGQDPTVRREKSRGQIDYCLNLDKGGALRKYLTQICQGLNISFEEIYGTNIIKYFYKIPPAETMEVLHAHLQPNLELLRQEIAAYPKARIITLGEPVLKLLAGEDKLMKQYWDLNKKTNTSGGKFKYSSAKANRLERRFYPFPHLPAISKYAFYENTLGQYLDFVKRGK